LDSQKLGARIEKALEERTGMPIENRFTDQVLSSASTKIQGSDPKSVGANWSHLTY
jgi:hypothetical protein